MNKTERMKELINILNEAAKAYYQEAREIMSNFEYDRLYDELVELEKETGTVLAGSPTVKVGFEVISELPKETHATPMLSLDKTKSVDTLADWLGDKEGVLSWKLDGLTVVLSYAEGKLVKAVTRGNGVVGDLVTNNAMMFVNLPLVIPYKGELTLRGEAIIKYSDFEKINAEIEDEAAKYKNPRNLCSGSIRQLNNEITKKRNVNLYAFSVINADGVDFNNSRITQLDWLKEQGFSVVPYRVVNRENIADAVAAFANEVKAFDIPSDGLVLTYDDIAYGINLGATAKFPRHSIAFKWQDETEVTHLLEIEWSPSRTGLINPVAIFEPVELEGTTVSRASVHNISVMEGLELGIGDEITVYKANMIIPQIADNMTKSGNVEIPKICPVCGGQTEIKSINGAKFLYCINDRCEAKHIKSFTHFVERDAMNIDGLSEETLEKFIQAGFLHVFADLYHLDRHKEEILEMRGFKEKTYNNIIAAVDASRNTTLPRLLYALGIANIGIANAKVICKFFDYDLDKIRHATTEDMVQIEGIGEVIGAAFTAYFADEVNQENLDKLLGELNIEVVDNSDTEQSLAGVTVVITGSLNMFENRNQLKEEIEKHGGKVAGSVSSNTKYLINNDVTSNSSKNKKAKELGVTIISEKDFVRIMNGN
ncbi:MAG: NAD-dependent DNA ligase LigA [Lachnospiraceae bacterium]|nr:NAD-dependent DNA ligase LigA [Lachnospiraceae bacterium]